MTAHGEKKKNLQVEKEYGKRQHSRYNPQLYGAGRPRGDAWRTWRSRRSWGTRRHAGRARGTWRSRRRPRRSATLICSRLRWQMVVRADVERPIVLDVYSPLGAVRSDIRLGIPQLYLPELPVQKHHQCQLPLISLHKKHGGRLAGALHVIVGRVRQIYRLCARSRLFIAVFRRFI